MPAVLFLAQFAGFSFLAFHRLIDSDEAFCLYISKLALTEGAVPYRDVFYQQMPLLPYIYGAWMKFFGFSWESGRSLSAVLAALVGTFLFRHVHRETTRLSLALSSLLLYALNISVLLFFLTAKTYVLSTSLLLGSLLVGVYTRDRSAGLGAGISGVLLALSVQTRLFFVAAVPAVVLLFWRRGDSRTSRKPFLIFLGGLTLGLVPTLIFMVIAPRQFIYDNLFYHAMRDPTGLIGDFEQKLRVAKNLVLGPGSFHPTQFSFLLCGIPLAFVFWRKLGDLPRLAAVTSVVLGLVSFLPTPTFGQYFCVLIPFLVISLAEAFGHALESASGVGVRRVLLIGFVFSSLLYAAAAVPRINSLFMRAEDMPGIGPTTAAIDWKLSTVKEIASLIESYTDEDSLVVSSWPGYFLTIDRKLYPKMENQIALDTSWKLSPVEADRFRMLRMEELIQAIADPRVQTVVAGNCTHRKRPLYRRETARHNYKLVSQIGNSEIYIREPIVYSAGDDD